MDEFLTKMNEIRITKTIEALTRNRMQGYYAKTKEELFQIIDLLVNEDEKITHGGSVTLAETGVLEHLKSTKGDKITLRADVLPENMEDYFLSAFSSDTYLTSSNAVTEKGELVNIDGKGNRVSAMIYGPKQVIVVVGYNKIVESAELGIDRIQSIAAPTNALRLGKQTPCATAGKCLECKTSDRICSSYVILAQQQTPNRIKVIFINDEAGY